MAGPLISLHQPDHVSERGNLFLVARIYCIFLRGLDKHSILEPAPSEHDRTLDVRIFINHFLCESMVKAQL